MLDNEIIIVYLITFECSRLTDSLYYITRDSLFSSLNKNHNTKYILKLSFKLFMVKFKIIPPIPWLGLYFT